RITTTGATFGTIPYLAPEVVRGAAASPRSDFYGLGVVLYEMLTARRPHGESSGAASLAVAAVRRPQPPSAHAPGLSAEVDRIVLHLLARDPAKRPADGAQLGVELRALSRGPLASSAEVAGSGRGRPAP